MLILYEQDYLLVVNYLSKWPIVKALPVNVSSGSVIKCFKEVFADFGTPKRLVTDNGPQFASREFNTYCRAHGISHSTSSPLHPFGNGHVERTVGTVKGMMKKCLQNDIGDWLKGLTAIRNTPIGEGGHHLVNCYRVGSSEMLTR